MTGISGSPLLSRSHRVCGGEKSHARIGEHREPHTGQTEHGEQKNDRFYDKREYDILLCYADGLF